MTSVSAHDLTRTRLCSTPGCPYDADQDSEKCSACTRRDGRGARDRAPRRLVRTEPVVPEAQRKTCRWDGCTEQSTGLYDRGQLANLCAEHEEEAREQAGRASAERWRLRREVPVVPDPVPPADPLAGLRLFLGEEEVPDGLVEKARAVLAAAEKLEAAHSDLAAARDAIEKAEAEYREALAGLAPV